LVSNSNIQIAASNSAFSSSEIVSHQDDVESASSLNMANESASDSFPRVFKEFDFLEAERDTISETESCFNWLSTMRPICSVADDNAADLEDVDAEEYNDQDENQQLENELDDEIDYSVGRGSMSFMSQRRNRRLSGRFSRPMSRGLFMSTYFKSKIQF
jgi:hypothetical protein